MQRQRALALGDDIDASAVQAGDQRGSKLTPE
jgi:hypothetical protein